MNEIVVPQYHSQFLTMTSLEIAALVESRHDNVKDSIKRLANKGIIHVPATQVLEEINNLGLPVRREVYLFSGERGKRDSIIVVAQLSPKFTARLVDRWQELESGAAQVNARPNTDTLDDVMDRKLIVAMDQYIRLTPNEVALPVGWATTARFGYFFGEGTADEWNTVLHKCEYITPAIGGWNICAPAFTIADRCQDGRTLGWDINGLTHTWRRDKIPLPEPAFALADQRLTESRAMVRI